MYTAHLPLARTFGHGEHRGRAAHRCDGKNLKLTNLQTCFAPPECRAVIDTHECMRHTYRQDKTTLPRNYATLGLSRSLALFNSLALSLPPSQPIPSHSPSPLPGPWPRRLGQAPFPCEPAMHSDETASTAAEAACEQGHSGVRSFGGALRRGVARIWLRGRGNLPWRGEAKRQWARSMASGHVDSYG